MKNSQKRPSTNPKTARQDKPGHPPRILIAPQTVKDPRPGGVLSSSVSETYAAAIRAAGGIPFIACCLVDTDYIAAAVGSVDGVLMTGGDDVDPRLYTARPLPKALRDTVTLDGPERDAFECLLIAEVFRQKKPLFAICRGMQMVNVALGGSLIVDIEGQVPQAILHRRSELKDQKVHEAQLLQGSMIASVCGVESLGVNSTHHQAVGRLAKVLRPTAVSRDGIVEGLELGLEHSDVLPYFLAVQFHPERLWQQHPEHLALFQSFTKACRRNRQ